MNGSGKERWWQVNCRTRTLVKGAACALVLQGCVACQAEEPTTSAEIEAKYHFPLIGYMSPWQPDGEIEARYKKIREGGINTICCVLPENMDVCRRAGLKAFVYHGNVMQRVDFPAVGRAVSESLARVGRNDALSRFYVWDEPVPKQFADVDLACKAVKAAGGVPFVNLLPTYAEGAPFMDGLDYEQYLERFIAEVKPTEISYDHYCLMEDDERYGASRLSHYWKNLEIVHKMAKKHGLPFWQVVLSEGLLPYREPTAADMRFQVFTSLAYGARGLGFFHYMAEQSGNCRGAPLNQFGDPTPLWLIVRELNLQVARLAPILLQLTTDDVYHLGDVPESGHGPGPQSLLAASADSPSATPRKTDGQDPLALARVERESQRGSFLVGEFTHRDGSRYLMVVNKNLKLSFPCKLQFREEPKAVLVCNPYRYAVGEKLTIGDLEPHAGDLWLAPGQGTLLRVESAKKE